MCSKFIILTLVVVGLTSQLAAGTISGNVTTKGARGKNIVIVYIENIDATYAAPVELAEMDQVKLSFEPHVLPIIVGTTVKFTNSDDVLHNVFTPDACAEKVNLGTWPKGESRDYTFTETGCVSLMLCNVHPDMEAWVLVLQNPFYTQVDADGNYVIKDVPPGEYKVTAWHERLKNKTESVTVTEDGSVNIDFALSRR
jgi:plastocyanin